MKNKGCSVLSTSETGPAMLETFDLHMRLRVDKQLVHSVLSFLYIQIQ